MNRLLSLTRAMIALMLFVSAFSAVAATAAVDQQPDFAFPEKVSANALAALKTAMKKNDSPAVVRSLTDYYLSVTAKNPDDSQMALDRIISTAGSTKDPVLRSMLNCLIATIYTGQYQSDRWKYDRRELPLEPRDADFSKWSGEQFRSAIAEYTELSLGASDLLKATPVEIYSGALKLGAESAVYYPTLYDFVVAKAIDNYRVTMRSYNNEEANRYFAPYNLYVAMRFDLPSASVDRILELYASLLIFHNTNTPALINVDLRRLQFVRSIASIENKRYFDVLRKEYALFADSEFSGNFLTACADMVRLSDIEDGYESVYEEEYDEYEEDETTINLTDVRWLYDTARNNILRFPTYVSKGCLENVLAKLSSQYVSITVPNFVRPGMKTNITVRTTNQSDVVLDVYKLPDMEHPFATLTDVVDGTVPFVAYRTLEYKFPEPGHYEIWPRENNKKMKNGSKGIYVTRLAVMTTSHKGDTDVWAVDPLDGQPVANANVFLKKNKNTLLGQTDADGRLGIKKEDGTIFAKADGSESPEIWFYSSRPSGQFNKRLATLLTDLAIYHPGDTVKITVIAYEVKNTESSLLSDFQTEIEVSGASGEEYELTGRTDDFGRATMEFVIPEDALTGTYCLRTKNLSGGLLNIDVSDYKMDTFKINLDAPQVNLPTHGDATIGGSVMSYSGFPLAETSITLTLKVMDRRYFFPWMKFSSGEQIFTTETKTDATGRFKIIIPSTTFSGEAPGNVYIADVTSTSTSGESHSAGNRFVFSDYFRVDVSEFATDINAMEPFVIRAKVVDFNEKDVIAPLTLTLMSKADSSIVSLDIPADGNMSLKDVASGEYKLNVECKERADVIPFTANVVVYRPTDTLSPVTNKFIWTPDKKFNVGSDHRLRWLFASDCPTRLLVTICSHDGVISREWIDVHTGMNTYDYVVPNDVTKAVMDVCGYGNYRFYHQDFRIAAPEVHVSLQIKAESFRDKLTPGADETWTFSVIDSDNNPKEAAVILDMYNAALDALSFFSFDFPSRQELYVSSPNVRGFKGGFYYDTSHLSDRGTAECTIPVIPEFNTYGMSLVSNSYKLNGRLYGLRMAKAEATSDTDDMVVAEEILPELEEVADAGDIQVVGYGTMRKQEPQFEYRQSEVPLAFYAPDLKTDTDGRLSFSFKVPNANASWRVRALAFTDRMLSATFDATVLTSKPVMVKPNLPRFVRSGDNVTVNAIVMNNTAAVSDIVTVVEIFNPADGKILSTERFENRVDSMASVTVGVSLKSDGAAPFVGYRIKSSTETFADGEQSLLPVLPATTPIIESVPFYIAPDSAHFAMTLPEFGRDARLTLQYCENPVWYVVSALPGLFSVDASTANQAGAAIFSAAIASGLINDNPEIEKALREWTASERTDSVMRSMLERNSDLKMMLLRATPWMMNAASDTERMTRLALLFDRKEINRNLKANLDALKRLERDGGGWAWIDALKESSEWSTYNLLTMFGNLNRLGYLPNDASLKSAIKSAVGYIDTRARETFAKWPGSDFTFYAFVRSLYPEIELPMANRSITAAAVNGILKGWKKHSVGMKAIDALVLNRYGHPAVAKTVLASLREYAVSSPDKGMSWPSIQPIWSMDRLGTTTLILDAFAEIEPKSNDIDKIIHWMVLQKEAMDWGSSVTTTEIISSILHSARKWLRPAQPAEITVNGHEVVPAAIEKVTGSLRADISYFASSDARLEINRNGNSPAWGSVMAQFTANIVDVKEASVPDLSISKRLLRYAADGSVEEISSLSVGDKVRVELTITAGRDMDYVAIADERASAFEPVEQLPRPIFSEGIFFYRENRNTESRIFVTNLPKGVYLITYDVWVNNAGTFISGVATIQSQYAPALTAHSAAHLITVN